MHNHDAYRSVTVIPLNKVNHQLFLRIRSIVGGELSRKPTAIFVNWPLFPPDLFLVSNQFSYDTFA